MQTLPSSTGDLLLYDQLVDIVITMQILQYLECWWLDMRKILHGRPQEEKMEYACMNQ